MSAAPGRNRRVAVVVLAFVSGAAASALAASAAASRSAHLAIHGSAGLFVYDQEGKLAAAWNAGDMNAALAHARCAYEARFGSSSRYFDIESVGWTTHALVVEPNAEVTARARPTEEAIARAKLAVILERLGRASEATMELDRAAQASGVRDMAKLHELGLKTVALTATPTGTR